MFKHPTWYEGEPKQGLGRCECTQSGMKRVALTSYYNCHSNSSSMLLYLSSATVCFHTCIIVWMPDRCMQHVQQIANDADLIYIAAFNCANKGPGANDWIGHHHSGQLLACKNTNYWSASSTTSALLHPAPPLSHQYAALPTSTTASQPLSINGSRCPLLPEGSGVGE